ncbi:MAG TPA: hypothetical protein DCZ94_00885 [Lentisphaeria bacterium]|nr:MAG: hypothetical protein A2X48_11885 [Lentisphaerae bacterium GWF2_49_21]HBC85485.1 hypothetical protein [Lentisphaeria bacterium]
MDENKNQPPPQDSQNASVNDIVHFVKALCLTYSQLAYYPATHPVTIKQMQDAWKELQPVFEKFGDVSISLTEGKMLFFGMPVEDRNPAVSKFAKHFESLHIHSIKFKKGLTNEEFVTFFTFFCKDTQAITDAGGVDAIIKEKNLQHITFNTAVYRVISEDEKVVSKSEVYSGKVSGEADEKTEMLRYFLNKMMDKSEDQKGLLSEIKNDPEKMAGQIVKIIEHIGTEGNVDRDSMVEALLHNIQMVSDTMSQKDPSSTGGEHETMANAMVSLENELQRKSKSMSSGASVRFVKRIADVVSSYTDKVKADKVLGEFLSHEKSLKAAEEMMKEISTGSSSDQRILSRIKTLMKEKGLQEDQLLSHLEGVAETRKPKKQISKTFHPLADRLQQKLDSEFKEIKEKDRERLLEYLNNVYVRETKKLEEKNVELQHELEDIQQVIQSVEEIFEGTNLGIILIDRKHNVCFIEHGNKLHFELMLNEPLPQKLIDELSNFKESEPVSLGNVTIMQVTRNPQKYIKAILFQYE